MRLLISFSLLTVMSFGQSAAVAIDTANGQETTVAGSATAGSGPITIINVQFPAEVKLGTGDVLRDGTFAVSLKTPLEEGHALVAVNRAGQRSERFVVKPRRTGGPPAPPSN